MKNNKQPKVKYLSLKEKGFPEINLSISEIEMSIAVGTLRRKECIRTSSQQVANEKNNGYWNPKQCIWDGDIEGAAAELALCKHKRIYWGAFVNNFKEADILDNVGVRHTAVEQGSLIVRPCDNLDHYYALVIGQIPTFYIIGFLHAREAAISKYSRDPHSVSPAWFVPKAETKDIKYLDFSGKSAVDLSPKNVEETITETCDIENILDQI